MTTFAGECIFENHLPHKLLHIMQTDFLQGLINSAIAFLPTLLLALLTLVLGFWIIGRVIHLLNVSPLSSVFYRP